MEKKSKTAKTIVPKNKIERWKKNMKKNKTGTSIIYLLNNNDGTHIRKKLYQDNDGDLYYIINGIYFYISKSDGDSFVDEFL